MINVHAYVPSTSISQAMINGIDCCMQAWGTPAAESTAVIPSSATITRPPPAAPSPAPAVPSQSGGLAHSEAADVERASHAEQMNAVAVDIPEDVLKGLVHWNIDPVRKLHLVAQPHILLVSA